MMKRMGIRKYFNIIVNKYELFNIISYNGDIDVLMAIVATAFLRTVNTINN